MDADHINFIMGKIEELSEKVERMDAEITALVSDVKNLDKRTLVLTGDNYSGINYNAGTSTLDIDTCE